MLCLLGFDPGFILMVEEQSALEVLTLPGTAFLPDAHSITEILTLTKLSLIVLLPFNPASFANQTTFFRFLFFSFSHPRPVLPNTRRVPTGSDGAETSKTRSAE